MKFTKTARGFARIEFTDYYGEKCSLQKSSLADKDAIWLGVIDAKPQIMAREAIRLGLKPREGGEADNGWVPYEVPDEVMMTTRMHLTRAQVKKLLPALKHFVKTGELPTKNYSKSG
jgi:hypothetical protein